MQAYDKVFSFGILLHGRISPLSYFEATSRCIWYSRVSSWNWIFSLCCSVELPIARSVLQWYVHTYPSTAKECSVFLITHIFRSKLVTSWHRTNQSLSLTYPVFNVNAIPKTETVYIICPWTIVYIIWAIVRQSILQIILPVLSILVVGSFQLYIPLSFSSGSQVASLLAIYISLLWFIYNIYTLHQTLGGRRAS